MRKIIIKASLIRPVLIVAVAIYAVANIFYFCDNISMRRFVTIERKTLGGVVLIDKTKYPTPHVIEQIRIGYTIKGPLEYLLLSGGKQQESFISALSNISFVLSLIVFLWKLNFMDPYHRGDFSRAYLAYRLFIAALLFKLVTNIYTQNWVGKHLHGPDQFYYNSHASVTLICFAVILLTAMLTLYGQAIRNKEELDLTI